MEIDSHMGCAMSGLNADARTMVEHARLEAQSHRFTYNEPMPVEACTQAICDLALRFGEDRKGRREDAMSRPFGVSLLIGGIDQKNGIKRPYLWHTDPSGTFLSYDAKAIGAGSEGAQSALQDSYNKSMTLKEAEKLALSVLKQVMEEKISSTNVEIASVTLDRLFRIYSVQETQEIIDSL